VESAQVGQNPIGRVLDLGVTAYGTNISIEGLTAARNAMLGQCDQLSSAPLRSSSTTSLKVTTQTRARRPCKGPLAEYRTIPVVLIASTTEELARWFYGYYRRFESCFQGERFRECLNRVEGLSQWVLHQKLAICRPRQTVTAASFTPKE